VGRNCRAGYPPITRSALSWSRPVADRGAHPRVRGIALYVAIPRVSEMRLRPPIANE